MTKMNPMDDKEFEDRKPYFEAGVHQVFIKGVSTGKTPNTGSDYIEFKLLGAEDEEGTARAYVTDKSMDYTRSLLARIAVHNKSTEPEKQKVREAFKAINDSDQMLDPKFLEKFIDNEAWILVEEDKSSPKPNGGFYLRTSLYSYEPKARPQTNPNATGTITDNGKIDLTEIPFE